ncbi:hypothetical protein BDA99DRAFT_602624 [Phascolomyces articulosus]|uniref:Homeodomain-like DNA binding domain-containing transcription factor n=1 Tax=Phascolomyces articulosus TaxID=60185 RepID=A0AAD5KIV2_9FUNG|nr:hypothetical protein BDA99DRAFT_602624 [Phascolomyces articulosus]
MNIQFLYENGKGSVVDEYGKPEPMDYIVDEEQFRLQTSSSHTQYLVQQPLESEKERGAMQKCLSAAAAEKRLGIHVRTVQKWAEQYERDPNSVFEKRRKTGRPRILNEEDNKVIAERIDVNPSVVLDDVLKHLKQVFTELKVSKSTLFDFVKKHCNLSLKKARFQLIDRNGKEKIQERLDWSLKWEKTDMDFTTNCVFLHESAFHINMKRSMGWSKKVSPSVVTVRKTRAKTTTILGAISAQGLIKCNLSLPQPPPNKKRKRGEDAGFVSKGIVMGHYVC